MFAAACVGVGNKSVIALKPKGNGRVTPPGQMRDIRPSAIVARIARSFAGMRRSLRRFGNFSESRVMNTSTKVAAALLALLMLASCGNTIRGVGRDTSNAVDATEDAANDVAN
jgi:predicted small secreted protein